MARNRFNKQQGSTRRPHVCNPPRDTKVTEPPYPDITGKSGTVTIIWFDDGNGGGNQPFSLHAETEWSSGEGSTHPIDTWIDSPWMIEGYFWYDQNTGIWWVNLTLKLTGEIQCTSLPFNQVYNFGEPFQITAVDYPTSCPTSLLTFGIQLDEV